MKLLLGCLFYLMVVALLACSFRPAGAAEKTGLLSVAAGVNGIWPSGDNVAFPSAFEAGATASSSLSPHISAVASSFYGFKDKYVRWDAGARVTASSVDDPGINVFLGAKYRGADKRDLFPTEWAVDAGFGWRPLKSTPALILGADAAYGLKTNTTLSVIALRWLFPVR